MFSFKKSKSLSLLHSKFVESHSEHLCVWRSGNICALSFLWLLFQADWPGVVSMLRGCPVVLGPSGPGLSCCPHKAAHKPLSQTPARSSSPLQQHKHLAVKLSLSKNPETVPECSASAWGSDHFVCLELLEFFSRRKLETAAEGSSSANSFKP